MSDQQPILDYGKTHLELVILLDVLAGGNGPYGNGKEVFDSWSLGDKKLPSSYYDRNLIKV